MKSLFETFALSLVTELVGQDRVNATLIDRLVNQGRSRPHPWSTKHAYVSWAGLSDRTYNARFLPANPYPPTELAGTRRPPLADVAALFTAKMGGQVADAKSTALFPAFAQYLTDGFIRTHVFNPPREEDRKRTTSNHEIDMSPLYGRTEAQTRVLRVANPAPGSKGQLKTSRSADGHIMPPMLYDEGTMRPEFCTVTGEPVLDEPLGLKDGMDRRTLFAVGGDRANANPQVAAINLLFLREHNRLAAALEAAFPAWDDDRVFETARNIVIVMFIKIVVEEYINHINPSVFRFSVDPRVAWDAEWNRPNWITAEFSLLYRWHPLAAESMTWDGQSISGDKLHLDNTLLMKHGLAKTMFELSANRAGRMTLGNSPWFLQGVEAKALAQARTNEIDTYNAYRRAMGFAPAATFGDLVGSSTDHAEHTRQQQLAADLQRLYGDVDNVEFYVGLFAEPPAENGPLPELLLAMVAMDAFSQALTNPLLSRHVWGDANIRRLAFTDIGLGAIEDTKRLRDVLVRNSDNLGDKFIGMTRREWKRQ